MTQTALKDQIKKLVELQKTDSEVYLIKTELKEKPEIVSQLSEEFEKEKSQLKECENKLKQILVKRKEIELDLKGKEDAIVKANGSLSVLKTNKEYSAKLAEIESIKADKSIFEEEILKLYDQGDVVQKEIDREKLTVAEKEKGFLAKKKEIEASLRIQEDNLKVLELLRQQLLAGIDKNILAHYEKILSHKEGLAIVLVKDHTCGGCFMNINHQMINRIKIQDEIVQCELCTRILYLEENL